MSEHNSIMEKQMEKLGVGKRKVERLPNTLDEGIAEIAYLRALENMSRRKLSILYRLHQATFDHIVALESERHKLEKLYVPVTHIPTRKPDTLHKQYVSPKTKAELMETWKGLTDAELQKKIEDLEKLI